MDKEKIIRDIQKFFVDMGDRLNDIRHNIKEYVNN